MFQTTNQRIMSKLEIHSMNLYDGFLKRGTQIHPKLVIFAAGETSGLKETTQINPLLPIIRNWPMTILWLLQCGAP